ncbi:hypothetical protein CROQUDRAFT_91991 [Cronartium quercuum f. sp. fusiforme G11]|uniref:Uncharacterized protein n=1 Tax=Cronartium quercuum f. sp. fusiforme G11 TaxID=708437 RepID=A0A9P6NHD3_9BASI|nr:hypothetical protein CROQUDRAFT_91991 [Cronartium quercuum f. sp. fusiforme G11]
MGYGSDRPISICNHPTFKRHADLDPSSVVPGATTYTSSEAEHPGVSLCLTGFITYWTSLAGLPPEDLSRLRKNPPMTLTNSGPAGEGTWLRQRRRTTDGDKQSLSAQIYRVAAHDGPVHRVSSAESQKKISPHPTLPHDKPSSRNVGVGSDSKPSMDFIPSEPTMPHLFPEPTSSSPSIFLANILLICFTPAIVCGFFTRHCILRPSRAIRKVDIRGSSETLRDPEPVRDERGVLSKRRLRLIYLVKLLTCLFLTLAGLLEILKPKPTIDTDSTGEQDELSITSSDARTVDIMNKFIGWLSLISVVLMYIYLVIQLLPPSSEIIDSSQLLMSESVLPAQLTIPPNVGERKMQFEDAESFYFWLKIPLFIPLIILVSTLRALLIHTSVQTDQDSEFKISIQSVRLATKIISLFLDIMLLIWILFGIFKLSGAVLAIPFTSIRRSETSFVANSANGGLDRPLCNYRTNWSRGLKVGQTRRKIAKIYRSWNHDTPLATPFNSSHTSHSLQKPDYYRKPMATTCTKSSFMKDCPTGPTYILKNLWASFKKTSNRFSSPFSRNEGSEQNRQGLVQRDYPASSWAFTLVCALKSPLVVSQLISIICCIVSLTSSEERGNWNESKLMDSLISGAIGYEGSIDYFLIVVMELLRLCLIIIEPVVGNVGIDARLLDLEQRYPFHLPTNRSRAASPNHSKIRPGLYLKAHPSINFPIGRRNIGIRRNRSIPQSVWPCYMEKSRSLGSLEQFTFTRARTFPSSDGRLMEGDLSIRSSSPFDFTSGTKTIKRVPVPAWDSCYPSLESSESALKTSLFEESCTISQLLTTDNRADSSTGSSNSVPSFVCSVGEDLAREFRDESTYDGHNSNSDKAMLSHVGDGWTGTDTYSDFSSRRSYTHPLGRGSSVFDDSDISSTLSPHLPPRVHNSSSLGIYPASAPQSPSEAFSPTVALRVFHRPTSQDSSGGSRFGYQTETTSSLSPYQCGSRTESSTFSPSPSIIAQLSQKGSSWTSKLSSQSQFLQQLQDELGMSRTTSWNSYSAGGNRPNSKSSTDTHHESSCPSDLEQAQIKQLSIHRTDLSDARPSISFFSLQEAISASTISEAFEPDSNALRSTRNTLESIKEKDELLSDFESQDGQSFAGDLTEESKTISIAKDTQISNASRESSNLETMEEDKSNAVYNRLSDPTSHPLVAETKCTQFESSQTPWTVSKFKESSSDHLPRSIFTSPQSMHSPLDHELPSSEIDSSVISHTPDMDHISRLHRKLSNDHTALLGKPVSAMPLHTFASLPSSPTFSEFGRLENPTLKPVPQDRSLELIGRNCIENYTGTGSSGSVGGSTSASSVADKLGPLTNIKDVDIDQLIRSNTANHRQLYNPIDEYGLSESNGKLTRNKSNNNKMSKFKETEAHLSSSEGTHPVVGIKKRRTVSSLFTGSVSQAGQVLSRRVVSSGVLKNVHLLGPISQKRSSQESFHCAGENAAYAHFLGKKTFFTPTESPVQESEENFIKPLADEGLEKNFNNDKQLSTAHSEPSLHRRAPSLGKIRTHSAHDSLSSTASQGLVDNLNDEDDMKSKKQAKLRKDLENRFTKPTLCPSPKITAARHTITPDLISLPQLCNLEFIPDLDTVRHHNRIEPISNPVYSSLSNFWGPEMPSDDAPALLESSLDIPERACDLYENENRLQEVSPSRCTQLTCSDSQKSNLKVNKFYEVPSSSHAQTEEDSREGPGSPRPLCCSITSQLPSRIPEEEEKQRMVSGEVGSKRIPENLPLQMAPSPSEDVVTSLTNSTTASNQRPSRNTPGSASTDSGEWNPFALEELDPLSEPSRVGSGAARMAKKDLSVYQSQSGLDGN